MGEFDRTLGTLLLGICFNTFLYGLVTYQFAAYCKSNFNDPLYVRAMVWSLFILDTFHSGSVMLYMAWSCSVKNYDIPPVVTAAEWPYTFTPIGTAATAVVAQLFLGRRIRALSESNILFATVILLAISSFALGMACGIKAWILEVHSELPQLNKLATAWLTMQVSIDIFITVTLAIILTRSKAGPLKTNTILNRLIQHAIQSGLFVGTFSLGYLISLLVFPTINLYEMFAIPIGRIYTTTLFGSLLMRKEFRSQSSGTTEMAAEIDVNWADSTSRRSMSNNQQGSVPMGKPTTCNTARGSPNQQCPREGLHLSTDRFSSRDLEYSVY